MKPFAAFVRSALWWLLPLAVLSAVVAYETGFGARLHKVPPPPSPLEPKPVATALLPEYAIDGGIASRRETVERALFTPTRRPAPQLVAEAAKPRMQRGQFSLTGTLIVDGKPSAFLRETSGGRSRRVSKGETINGLTVTDVQPDRVKLAMGDEVEELVLRVSTNPRPTPPAVVAGAAIPGVPAPALPIPATAAVPGAVVPTPDVAATLAERRRAARAAQAAAAAGTPQQPVPGSIEANTTRIMPQSAQPPASQPAPTPATPPARNGAPGGPTWNDVYQRYQYRTR
jgi:hypothetical protein